jgi:hypothetical protein
MGKVKNLEEKKKAARVFSSGSGGGTKGPSVVDKRNQELACPHCPRIFKQVAETASHNITTHIVKIDNCNVLLSYAYDECDCYVTLPPALHYTTPTQFFLCI